jgi:D-glycero-alpha-D-manno-heptose-7-phosphate kinase
MIVTRTPYRVSFLGGGSDYPAWYQNNVGAVLSMAIDKYCVIVVRYLPPFFEHKHRIVYRIIEAVRNNNEINHPAVRECFKFMNVERGIEVVHIGDVPARSGLGTSSSFTVGMLNSLYALRGEKRQPMQLALDAIHVEQDLIGEMVGAQDQTAAAFGGFNKITFVDGGLSVTKIDVSQKIIESLMLVYVGLPRYATDVVQSYKFDSGVVSSMVGLVDEAVPVVKNGNIAEFGRLLRESWGLKQRLSEQISTPYVSTVCELGQRAGACGFKLCGAGGGGFVLMIAEPDAQESIKNALKGFLIIPFDVDNEGSKVMFNGAEDLG